MEEKYKQLGEDVNVIMINIEGEDIDSTAKPFAEKHGLTLPHFAVDSMEDVDAFGVQFIPHHAVISEEGVVLASPAEGDAFDLLSSAKL